MKGDTPGFVWVILDTCNYFAYPLPMRPFPDCDRVRGLNISDCPSPECFTCSKGEFLKCTEDDRAGRIRMAAGCLLGHHPSSGKQEGWHRYKCFFLSLVLTGGLLGPPESHGFLCALCLQPRAMPSAAK